MKSKYVYIIGFLIIVVIFAIVHLSHYSNSKPQPVIDPTPQNVTLSGTYVCLPHVNTSGPQTEECAFGFKTDDGVYYAVNFGQSADAMQQFQAKEHVTAEGNVVPKETLNTDQWNKYNMKGIFTITKVIDSTS